MYTTYQKYPGFNNIEIVAELEAPRRKQPVLKPVTTGNKIQRLDFKPENLNRHLRPENAHSQSSVLIRKLSQGLLVISFYSKAWGTYGLKYLRQLNELQQEIDILGGQLLIVTPDAADNHLAEVIWDYSLNLHFYFDPANIIANKFGIYAGNMPAWNNYSGIENNIPLLATYVIDSFYKVLFSHVDEKLLSDISKKELLHVLKGERF
ncbi:redoxin domain-containing protein [Mucilaginibacter flavus]|uniref:redoxin domain-containing protein n=1 Tax=Mucilaginibacter flavus TaxID=931504 RepID=UPI0025B5D39A|nr:redoxin domain-containing protein [Mucilaginibacter flavus]MDN3582056.1 redoxin domain-containing protein [Mucilaginibacter flavus]